MGNDIRKGNRSSIPSRGGMRRSNTPPPPSVRLGIDGLPEVEPISTSRPRGNELPKGVPMLDNLPAEPPPAPAPEVVVAKAPPPEVVLAKAPPPEVVVAKAAEVAKAKTPPPEPVAPPVEAREPAPSASVPPDAETSGGVSPSIAPRRSVAPGNRKRGSNLRGAGGKSMPPPPAQPIAVQPDEVSTAKAPPVVHADVHSSEHASEHRPEPEQHELDAHEERAPASRPRSAPPSADLDEGFFDHGERAAADAHREAADLESYDEKMAQKNSPEARARRAKNWRYVLIAGAACVLLLLIADVKNRSSHGDSPAVEPPVVVNVAPPPSAVPPKVEPTPVPVIVPPASSADEPVVAPAASGSAQAAGAAPGAPADSKWVAATASAGTPGSAPPAAVAAEPTSDDKKSAAQEKHTAQSFLDQGAFAKAVAAGEHSVALDPTDGEAWLLLGAAYQSMGKGAEARRTFASCVAEGKRGPINECRAMLR